jgi:hypothetical protein
MIGPAKIGLEHCLVKEEGFLGITGEVEVSGDAGHGGWG